MGSQSVISALSEFFELWQQSHWIGTIILPIWQMRTPRFREMKWLTTVIKLGRGREPGFESSSARCQNLWGPGCPGQFFFILHLVHHLGALQKALGSWRSPVINSEWPWPWAHPSLSLSLPSVNLGLVQPWGPRYCSSLLPCSPTPHLLNIRPALDMALVRGSGSATYYCVTWGSLTLPHLSYKMGSKVTPPLSTCFSSTYTKKKEQLPYSAQPMPGTQKMPSKH